jgi:hypothetical protein
MSDCPICGADPCVNSSFCAACREADQRKTRGDRPHHIDPLMWNGRPARIPHDWNNMASDALWQLFNNQRRTPQSTTEAVILCVRERGLEALEERANIERLSRCDVSARAQINDRIARIAEQNDAKN